MESLSPEVALPQPLQRKLDVSPELATSTESSGPDVQAERVPQPQQHQDRIVLSEESVEPDLLESKYFDQVAALNYVTTPEASSHRAIIDVFARAKRRYRVQLRPGEIEEILQQDGYQPRLAAEQVRARLERLREWGNLAARHDATAVERLDDFYHKRLIYRLTPIGEAAYDAVSQVEQAVESTGALQATMLRKILSALEALTKLGKSPAPDPDKTKSILDDLHAAFGSLTTEASRFIGELQRFLTHEGLDADSFILRKQALVSYLRGFVQRLIVESDPIRRYIRAIDRETLEGLLDVAVRSVDLPPALGALSPADQFRREQRERWDGVVQWFAPQGGDSVERQLLRVADQSVSQLVHSLHRLRDRMSQRVDRSADFRQLARWFSACPSDQEAHELFMRAFGLHSARHFHLVEEDQDLVTPRTSWWESEPVQVPVHLRRRGTRSTTVKTGKRPDYSVERNRLRAKRLEEQERRAEAVCVFQSASGSLRFSDLPHLDAHTFAVFLELLDAALSGDRSADGTRQGETEDGHLRAALRPIPGSAPVAIETSEGRFTATQDAELIVEVLR